mgnify:CR=1 FL=1
MASKKKQGPRYVVVRAYSAGVFVGEVIAHDPKNPSVITLGKSRRIWSWSGGRLSLHEVALRGVGSGSRVSEELTTEHTIVGVIEVIGCSAEGESALRSVAAYRP